jgi:PadR family transcriptional regulator, regulatory protein PadR
VRQREPSPQTRALLVALREEPTGWKHGYDLSRKTGLRSGTLYPVLARLAERGLLEAMWEHAAPEGRPRRHLYRLSAAGAAAAATLANPPANERRLRSTRSAAALG